MNALEFGRKYIVFEKASPICGAFDITRYRMLEKPLIDVGNIGIKQMVVYKASSCMGTVFAQIATAYRLDQRPGDMIAVAQSDDDAGDWSKTRVRPFLERIPPLMATLKNTTHAITNDLWQWPHQFLILTGPGLFSQNSKQVRYIVTDESHLYAAGTLTAFDKRMGGRWDRAALHVTTAADEGAEIDGLYYDGKQNEFHHRCVHCHQTIWLLWTDAAKEHYNGESVFKWDENQSEIATLNSIRVICPLCGKENANTDRVRFAMQTDGDYVSINPDAPDETQSYRWNCFAAHWINWRDILAEHFAAMAAAKMGDLKKHEDFVKKRECRSYTHQIPDLGIVTPYQDYRIGEIWITEEEKRRIASFDVQDAGGLHFWAQVDEFIRNGNSRRLNYDRLGTWEACKEYADHYGVAPSDTFVDYGHRDREVFARCSAYRWYALKSGDEEEFTHVVTIGDGSHREKRPVPKPFSATQTQDSMSGKSKKNLVIHRNSSLPEGWCYSRLWSKPYLYPMMFALKSGTTGRYYGIAEDINSDYTKQIHSYVPRIDKNKKTGAEKVLWQQVKAQDHAFITSCQCLIGAIIAGYFPMDFSSVGTVPEKAA